jgi:signal transduction histidine kinase
MRFFRTWPVLAFALSGLLGLILASVVVTKQKARDIFAGLDEMNSQHRLVDRTLRRLRSDIHVSGIFIRDYLLDPTPSAGPEYRQELAELRASTGTNLEELEKLVGSREEDRIRGLRTGIAEYWETFDPVFDWTPAEKSARSLVFLRKEVLPRRDAVLGIANEIEEFNNANMVDQRAQVASREEELQASLVRILWVSLGLGALVSLGAVARIRILELRHREQHERTELAEDELRRLSNRLVLSLEDERRRLARELHDEVGQMLTALRMEVGKAERLRGQSAAHAASIAESKRVIETMMQTVRNLAMGLRPTMLDDFGLGAALDWHVRDFSRRFDVPVFLTVDGDVDRLPEPHRTCVYRVVQEALTNCAKHARAKRVEVTVREQDGRLALAVTDDGVGMAQGRQRRSGFGLIGIEERVREVGGDMNITSDPGKGTALAIRIPLPPGGGATDEASTG